MVSLSSRSKTLGRRVVIVGGGVAAHHVVTTLRAASYEGSVTILGAEPLPPYDRTMVTKDLLLRPVTSDELLLATPSDYERLGVDLRLSCVVTALDERARQVVTASGDRISYDALVLATGGAARRLPAQPPAGVHVLRTARDAAAVRIALGRAIEIAVVGGGFVGLEVASAARELGVEVHLIQAGAEPLAGVLGKEVGRLIRGLHEINGVQFRTGSAPKDIQRAGDRWRLTFASRPEALEVDAIVAAVGMYPNGTWLGRSAVGGTNNGVMVDTCCRTSVPDVFACGDCTVWQDPTNGSLMRPEHWEMATRHGITAAHAILGVDEPFNPVPFFWSDQHGVKLQFVGFAHPDGRTEIDQASPQKFVVRYVRDDQVTGVFAAGNPRAIFEARDSLRCRLTAAA